MGWNTLHPYKHRSNDVIDDLFSSRVYYVNSYRATLNSENEDWALATTNYGEQEFLASVNKGDIFATQFHPEKSGEPGLNFINNFL